MDAFATPRKETGKNSKKLLSPAVALNYQILPITSHETSIQYGMNNDAELIDDI